MTAVTFTQTDEVMGELANGLKLVYTKLICDDGEDVGVVTIKPLKSIEEWFVGVNSIGACTSSYSWQAVYYNGGGAATERSGESTSGYFNAINLKPPADGTNNSGTVLYIVALGV